MAQDSSENVFPYKAVLWDIDGTLADSEPHHARSFHEASADQNLALPSDFHDQLLGNSEEQSHAWLVETCGLRLSLSEWTQARYAAYLRDMTPVTFFPLAQQVWQMTEQLGVAQAMVSNADRCIVDANLRQLGLEAPHRISISRNDVSKGKPHPEPYLMAAKMLGISPAEIAVVEDSATGLEAGRNAGMQVFMMPSFDGKTEHDWWPLSDLLALATALASRPDA